MSDSPTPSDRDRHDAGDVSPRVLILYSWDSREHRDRVKALGDRLRGDGIDCQLDQYVSSPPQGWNEWMENEIDAADFVIVICTEEYYRRVNAPHASEERGRGVRWELAYLKQDLYDSPSKDRLVVVQFQDGEREHIPKRLRDCSRLNLDDEEGYKDLYRWLRRATEKEKPDLGELKPLAPRESLPRKFDPFFVHNLPHKNEHFTGRDELMPRLRAALLAGGNAALTQRAAVHGLAGVGKTEMALAYAYEYQEHYDIIWWVRAEKQHDALTLLTDLRDLAAELGLPEAQAPDLAAAADAARRELESRGRWLLIFDNVNEPEDVEDFLPRAGGGHVLITSRHRNWGAVAKSVEVDCWPLGESVRFLQARTGDRDDEGAREIAQLVDGLPLALEQAAAYIERTGFSLKEYAQRFREAEHELLSRGVEKKKRGDPVAVTWEISFQRLEQDEHAGRAAAELLNLCAFLDPDDIPLEIFQKAKRDEQLAERGSNVDHFDRIRIRRAIRFAETTVGEAMIPIAEVVAVSNQSTTAEVVERVRKHGYNRLPVFEDNISHVVGVLTLTTWDLLDADVTERPLVDLVKPAHFVTHYETIDELLPVLKSRDDHMAIVVDEYGSAIGLITMEDIIEEVVGDIDVGYEFEEYQPRKKRQYRVLDAEAERYDLDARLPISVLNDLLGLSLPTTEFHTAAGLVIARLRHLPRAGDEVVESGFRFCVEELNGPTITRIVVERDRPQEPKPRMNRWRRNKE